MNLKFYEKTGTFSTGKLRRIKRYTNCRIFVGRNGRIWADGTPEGIQKIERAIRLIEREAHTYGLTERVLALLKGE